MPIALQRCGAPQLAWNQMVGLNESAPVWDEGIMKYIGMRSKKIYIVTAPHISAALTIGLRQLAFVILNAKAESGAAPAVVSNQTIVAAY